MANVPSRAERGRKLEEWVDATEGMNVSRLAKRAKITRNAVYAAFRGEASEATYRKLEAAVENIDHPEDQPDEPRAAVSTEEGIIEVELTDVYGVGRIAVRGPVGNTHELEEFVRRVIDHLQQGRD